MNPLQIGNVIGVESGRVEILVTVRDLTILHEERTYRVGQLSSYVTIPMDERTIVGFVAGAARREKKTPDIDPPLVIQVHLIGEIVAGQFKPGISEYPIVGDDVWLAYRETFATIFGSFDQDLSGSEHCKSFRLGRFAHDTDFEVKIIGSPFFAKHVAILGNSGSGKSCATAKILQEVLDLRQSQVVLFDMHGEYRRAFSDADGQVNANVTCLGVNDLVLPYWLLKYEELEELFVDTSNPLHISTQISFLRTAILEFKRDAAVELGLTKVLTLDTPIYYSLDKLKIYAENLNNARFVLNDDHYAFSQLTMRSLHPDEQNKLMREQPCQFNRGNPQGETPHPLYFGKLLGLIDQLETKFSDRRYEFLFRPFEHGLNSRYFRDHIKNAEGAGQISSLMNHMIKLLTGHLEPRSNLTIIDLSGIPFEIVDVTVAVLTRVLFDLNFWTPAKQRHPILLAFEEAHNYIPRNEHGRGFAQKAVERVAKEGRKYGVSAMVISQRPSELSETVLSQCNSFIVMRLSNPLDQQYVGKVVGDHFTGVVSMLPVLRPGEGFVIGDSVPMPMRTLIDLPDPTPLSGDVDVFQHWASGGVEGDIDDIINYWRRQDRHRLAGATEQATEEQEKEQAAQGPQPPAPRKTSPIPPGVPRKPPAIAATPRRRFFAR